MKIFRYLMICFFGFWVLACEPTTQDEEVAKPHPNQNEGGVKRAFFAFNDAFAKAERESLASMLTDDYQHTNGASLAIGKLEWLRYIDKRREDLVSGKLTLQSYDTNELKVSMYEKSALLTGRIAVAEYFDGEFRKKSYRVSTLWIWEDKQWKRAGFHDGEIK